MPSTPEPISYIGLGGEEHPIDAVTVEGKNVSELQVLFSNDFQLKSNLVTSIDSSSTDSQYMSAKCLYDMVYGSGSSPQPSERTLNGNWTDSTVWDGSIIWE